MREIFILLLIVGATFQVEVQRAKIKFETKVHNFGKIGEGDGKVSYDFVFTNSGGTPLLIKRVETSCGCTVSKWERSPIDPGRTSVIAITLDPKNRPGRFTKGITVYTNSVDTPNVQLKITGDIIAGSKKSDSLFPVVLGTLRLERDTVYMSTSQSTVVKIQMRNIGIERVAINRVEKPDYLNIDYSPLIFLPGYSGTLLISGKLPAMERGMVAGEILIGSDRGEEKRVIIISKD